MITSTLSGTDAPAPGVEVAFIEYDPSDRPDWMRSASGDELFAAVAEHGVKLRTEMDGTVRLPHFDVYGIVVARSGELRGQTWLDPDQDDEWTLTLAPLQSVGVRVVDGDGAVAAGVTVAVRAGQYGSQWPIARAVTGADGRARIEFQVDESLGSQRATFDVAALVPAPAPPHVAIDVEALPEEPVEIVLTETGTLRVEVVGPDGEPWTESVRVLVTAVKVTQSFHFANPEDDPSATFLDTADGTASFPHVGAGCDLVVSVRAHEGEWASVSEKAAGPAIPGAEVVHSIRFGTRQPTVVGRLEYDDGTPAAGVILVAQVRVPGNQDASAWGADMKCTTGEDGEFEFALDTVPAPDEKAVIQIARRTDSPANYFDSKMLATKSLAGLRAEVPHELGTIVLARPQMLVSGRVLGPDGEPVAAAVAVMRGRGAHGGDNPADGAEPVATDAAGRFTIMGTAETETLALGVTCDGYYLEEQPSFERGAADVLLRMSRAGALAGSLKIPDELEQWNVQVVVTGDVIDIHGTRHPLGYEGLTTHVDDDGSFRFAALRPGTGTVKIRLGWSDDDTVLTVGGVDVVAGETVRDPRLQEVDLAALLDGFAITVLDSDHKPLPGATVHARRSSGSGGFASWREFSSDSSGVARLRVRADSVEVIVLAEGHRFAELSGVDGDRTVVLEKGVRTAVTLRLAQSTRVPDPPHELRAQLAWAGALGTTGPGDGEGHDPRAAGGSHVDGPAFGREREVTLSVLSPGRYRVELWHWEHEIHSATGSTVSTSPEVVIITVPGDGTPITHEVAADSDALQSSTEPDD